MASPRIPLASEVHPTPATARRLSDRQAFAWEVIWTFTVIAVLAFFWVLGRPYETPLWTVVVIISTTLSSALTVVVSRYDATLVQSVAPAMLLLALASTESTTALAVWGTSYFLGSFARLRHLGDASEMTAYILASGMVTTVAARYLETTDIPWPISVFICIAIYSLTRLMVSSIRLAVVTRLSFLEAARGLLFTRVLLVCLTVSIIALASLALQHGSMLGEDGPTGALWGGAVSMFLVGITTFVISTIRESHLVAIQLSGTLEAALALPWSDDESVEEHALRLAQRALPRYTIELRREAGRNVNEIVSPFTDTHLVARRGLAQPPFLIQDQRILDAIAHIADTMIAVRRERDALSLEAVTDDLTGLPNYRGLRRALASITHEEAARGFAIAYIDVDAFKDVNDRHGHEVGNAVLRTLASRMRAQITGSDVVARVGGDEFMLILHGIDDEQHSTLLMERLIADTSAPILVGDEVISVALSFGLAFAGDESTDVRVLVEMADARMYAARGRQLDQAGRSTIAEIRADDEVADLVQAISTAIREQRLIFAYQPIVDCQHGRIVALEALVRPNEQCLASVGADVIVHEARRLGLLTELSTQLVRVAVSDMKRFQGFAPALTDVHINIDVEQVTDPVFIKALAEARSVEGVQVTLELGETSLTRASDDTHQELERLRSEAGVRVALDDFGRESSTLLSVVQYPFDVLKIDRALGQGIESRKAQLVMESMAALTASLHVQMIVEGVEDAETCDELRRVGVRYMQGYRFGAALSADELANRLERHGLEASIP